MSLPEFPDDPNDDVRYVTRADLLAALDRAYELGLDLGPGSVLEDLTVAELQLLVANLPLQ